MMLNSAILIIAIWMLIGGGQRFTWLGVLFSALPFSFLIGRVMLTNRARTKAHLPILAAISAAGTIMAIAGALTQGAGAIAPILAAAASAGFLAYDYWYSRLKRFPTGRIVVGKALPDFVVKRVGGGIFRPADLVGKPSILIFYRGNWCPLCMAQIREIAASYNRLESLGVRVGLISPQPQANTADLAEKIGVNFDFFTDEDNMAARILGIESRNGIPMGMQMLGYESETVLPTVIITDGDGQVIWVDETDNYRVRPEPETYFEVLQRTGAIKAD